MNHAKWFVGTVVLGALFFGCKAKEPTAEGQPEKPKAEAPAEPKSETPATAPASGQPAVKASAPAAATHSGYDRALLRAALLKDKAPETFQVKFTTTRGDFIVTVNRVWAPIGADRFYNLVKHHFYDNASFFRVVPGFVVQTGYLPTRREPLKQAQQRWVHNLQPEINDTKHVKGIVSMARGEAPDSATTSFFICTGASTALDGQYTAFGRVVDGMAAVEAIEQAPRTGETPNDRIELKTVKVEPR